MRAISHYMLGRFSVLPVIEALILFQSMYLGHQIRFIGDPQLFPPIHGIAFGGAMMLTMVALGLYDSDRQETYQQTIQRILIAYLLAMLALSVLFFSVPDARPGRGVFAIASMIAIVTIAVVRYVVDRAVQKTVPQQKTLLVGGQSDLDQLQTYIQSKSARTSARIAGFLELNPPPSDGPNDTAPAKRLEDRVKSQNIREIVVACRDQRGAMLPMAALLEMRMNGTRVLDLLTFFERELGLIRLDHLRSSWLVFGDGFNQGEIRRLVKRLFDLMASSLFLIAALPVIAVTAVAIYLETGAPVLFTQKRVGEGGRQFRVLKFRSMKINAEQSGSPQFAQQGDPRITRVGRVIRALRIDELPQLVNVLKGEMSFVGPRPERPEFVEQFNNSIPYYSLRHRVKPGITGWAQIRLPYANSFEASREKLEYDLYYLKNHSIVLDSLIMFETVQVVLLRRGM